MADTEENVFDKLHRLTSDRDRRNVSLKAFEHEIEVLEAQLFKKKQELADNKKATLGIEAKIRELAQGMK